MGRLRPAHCTLYSTVVGYDLTTYDLTTHTPIRSEAELSTLRSRNHIDTSFQRRRSRAPCPASSVVTLFLFSQWHHPFPRTTVTVIYFHTPIQYQVRYYPLPPCSSSGTCSDTSNFSLIPCPIILSSTSCNPFFTVVSQERELAVLSRLLTDTVVGV